ncbi:MAG: hypothetical protein RMJ98_16580 [Myxococcales bacterium]|nr:hypothetical protein [Polyangiaceae bacterium]MDW8250912.1 hypothetical protein [Myxococcales bacterium]
MRSSLFLALLAPTALLLLIPFLERSRGTVSDISPAPTPSVLLRADEAQRIRETCRGDISLDPYRLDPHPVDQVGFQVSSARETRFCHLGLGPGGALSELSCPIMLKDLQGMSLIGSSKGDAFWLAGLERVVRLDGTTLATTALGRASVDRVFITATGAVVKLRDSLGGQLPGAVWSKGDLHFEVEAPPGAFLAAGHLLRESDGILYARTLLEGAPGFGSEISVGPGGGMAQGRMRACRHARGWEVVLPEEQEGLAVIFRVYSVRSEGWSGPREARGEGVGGERWSLACSPGEARIAWAASRVEAGEDVSELRLLRCGAQGCQQQQATVRGLGLSRAGARVEAPWLLSIGEEMALLWSRGASTEARIAPLRALAQASSQRLVAEAVDVAASEAVVRQDAALVLLRSQGQPSYVFPFRLGRDGAKALGCGPPD